MLPAPSQPVRHRLYWTLFLATAAALTLLIRHHVRGLDLEVRREGLSNAAVVACRSVLLDLVDVETGLRGYLIVGNRDYLRPYHEGLGRFDADLARLRAAVNAIPAEKPHADIVAETSKAVLAEFSNQVSILEAGDLKSARERFVSFPTKPGVDQVRAHLVAIQAQEDARLAANMENLERSMATTLFLIDLFVVVIGLLLLATATSLIAPAMRPEAEGPGPGS